MEASSAKPSSIGVDGNCNEMDDTGSDDESDQESTYAYDDESSPKPRSYTFSPAIMYACKESRVIGAKSYQPLWLHSVFTDARIDWNRDILFINISFDTKMFLLDFKFGPIANHLRIKIHWSKTIKIGSVVRTVRLRQREVKPSQIHITAAEFNPTTQQRLEMDKEIMVEDVEIATRTLKYHEERLAAL